ENVAIVSDAEAAMQMARRLITENDGEPPYDMEYTDDYDIPELWLDIDQIQSMAQMHLYYITNAKTELKFSSSDNESINLNEDNTNSDLIMENTMKLDKFNELNRDNSNSDILDQRPDESIYYEDSNIDFEAIFDEESEINQ
ncbi:4742_t:CDS:2, partial [Rhizophagus irregularis]